MVEQHGTSKCGAGHWRRSPHSSCCHVSLVCKDNHGTDESWLWGDLTPFGNEAQDTYQIHCYYDNEPGCCKGSIPVTTSCTKDWEQQCPVNEHDKSVTPPPHWEAMRFWKNNDYCEIWGWTIAKSENTKITSYWSSFDGQVPEFKLRVLSDYCQGTPFEPW